MIVLAGLVGGAVYGGVLARRRGGRGLDRLHYAAGYGILFGLLGMFLTIGLERML